MLRLAAAIVVVALVFGGWWLFEYGRSRAGYDWHTANQTEKRLRAEIASLQNDLTNLHRENARLESSVQIDNQSTRMVRKQMAKLQQENLELREELQFYRNIVSPTAGRPGVHIQHFKIDQGPGARRYIYRLTLIHVQALKKRRVKVWGQLDLRVEGVIKGQSRLLGLAELSPKGRRRRRFGFKYFQRFEGKLVLPAGFTPKAVTVQVKTTRGKILTEKKLKWPQ
jgi:hypothetical protein